MRGIRLYKVIFGFFFGLCLTLSCAFGASYSPYTESTPSTGYVDWLKGVMANRDGEYVIWRDSQYVYRIAYGDLVFDDSNYSFAGDVDLVTLQLSQGYNTNSSLSFSHDSSFVLSNSARGIVFSSLGGYPDICNEGGKRYEIQALLFAIAVLFVYLLLDGIFSAVRRTR